MNAKLKALARQVIEDAGTQRLSLVTAEPRTAWKLRNVLSNARSWRAFARG